MGVAAAGAVSVWAKSPGLIAAAEVPRFGAVDSRSALRTVYVLRTDVPATGDLARLGKPFGFVLEGILHEMMVVSVAVLGLDAELPATLALRGDRMRALRPKTYCPIGRVQAPFFVVKLLPVHRTSGTTKKGA